MERVGVAEGDVGPEHGAPAVTLDDRVHGAEPVEVDGGPAATGHGVARSALAHVVGLVAADVDERRGEAGEELVEEVFDEGERARVGGAERVRALLGDAPVVVGLEGPFGGLALDFREGRVAGQAEPAAQMAEAVLVGGEFDASLAAVRVEFADFLRGDGRGVAPDLLVVCVSERVLGVELEVVEFEALHLVDEGAERVHRRHLVARDVEHDPPEGEGGPIVDVEAGESHRSPLSGLKIRSTKELRERGEGGAEAGRVAGGDENAAGIDVERVRGVREFGVANCVDDRIAAGG